jgi:uncharacterized protein
VWPGVRLRQIDSTNGLTASRAADLIHCGRCLAVIVASPRLLETSCSTIEQMRLVNALCWAKNFADGSR